jgi:uncharacterized protein
MEENIKKFILKTARNQIASVLKLGWKNYRNYKEDDIDDESLHQNKGTFVTLTIEDTLRGCRGQITPDEPLLDTIKENAVSAAFRDPRFAPLSPDEFYVMNTEVSILSIPEKMEYSGSADMLEKIKPNVHGVIIRQGNRAATFLPQVWDELPSKKEFFEHLCMKAGLAPDEWTRGKLEVHLYTVSHFSEEELNLKI